jgi:hypothetical protein
MHVSAKADYGMRALCELAAAYRIDPAKLVKGEQIATAQQIPIKFLEGILRQLRQAGISADMIATGSPKKRYDKAVKQSPAAILRVNEDGYYGMSGEGNNDRLKSVLQSLA